MITLFTLIPVITRFNPYRQVGTIHNSGLDYIIANLGTGNDVASLTTNYIQSNYASDVTYAAENIDAIAVKGYNITTRNVTSSLAGIDLNGGASVYVQTVFNFVNTFPPLLYANNPSESYIIFDSAYADNWLSLTNELLDDILDSGLSSDQMALALVAFAAMNASYNYWNAAYNNSGGSNAWYTYITGQSVPVNSINWRQLIQQDIKGALMGAVAGGVNSPSNVDGGVIVGAAADGMAASAQNAILQTAMIAGG